jgi:hypothetical protein
MSKYPTGFDEYWAPAIGMYKNVLMAIWHATFVEMTNEQVVMQQMTKKGRDGEWANDGKWANDVKWANGKNGQMTKNRAKDRKWAHR